MKIIFLNPHGAIVNARSNVQLHKNWPEETFEPDYPTVRTLEEKCSKQGWKIIILQEGKGLSPGFQQAMVNTGLAQHYLVPIENAGTPNYGQKSEQVRTWLTHYPETTNWIIIDQCAKEYDAEQRIHLYLANHYDGCSNRTLLGITHAKGVASKHLNWIETRITLPPPGEVLVCKGASGILWFPKIPWPEASIPPSPITEEPALYWSPISIVRGDATGHPRRFYTTVDEKRENQKKEVREFPAGTLIPCVRPESIFCDYRDMNDPGFQDGSLIPVFDNKRHHIQETHLVIPKSGNS